MAYNGKALAMLGHSKLFSPEQKYSKQTKTKYYESKVDWSRVSPNGSRLKYRKLMLFRLPK